MKTELRPNADGVLLLEQNQLVASVNRFVIVQFRDSDRIVLPNTLSLIKNESSRFEGDQILP